MNDAVRRDSTRRADPSDARVPKSGLRQGAEEYLRYSAQHRSVDGDAAQRLRTVLEERDARVGQQMTDLGDRQ